MFKYLWMIPLIIGYILGWRHSLIIVFEEKTNIGLYDDFTLGWLGTHLLGLLVTSFLAWRGLL